MARYLIDTQIFVWFAKGDVQMPPVAKEKLTNRNNEIFLSVASIWEIVIKVSIKKLNLAAPLATILGRYGKDDFKLLPIELGHALATGNLPFHHRDPFDRLLVAQAQSEDLEIISTDKVFDAYGVKRVG